MNDINDYLKGSLYKRIYGREPTQEEMDEVKREVEEENKRLAAEAIRNHQKYKKEYLKDACLLGEKYKNATFDNTQTGFNKSFDEAYIRCSNYCKAYKECLDRGLGIYLFGSAGVGKTRLSACMCNYLTDEMQEVLFTSVIEIIKEIKKTFKNNNLYESELIDKIATINFLFLDDLGTELLQKNGEETWVQEKLYDVINKRYNNKKPTIFTSNYSINELITERGLSEKTADRIYEMSNAIIKVEGTSFRGRVNKGELPF